MNFEILWAMYTRLKPVGYRMETKEWRHSLRGMTEDLDAFRCARGGSNA